MFSDQMTVTTVLQVDACRTYCNGLDHGQWSTKALCRYQFALRPTGWADNGRQTNFTTIFMIKRFDLRQAIRIAMRLRLGADN